MSDTSTIRFISMYEETAPAPLFLAGFFQSPPQNFHNTESVEIDIERDDEDVAVVINDISVGPRSNEVNQYTNKGFTPPIYDEKGPITAFDLLKRMAGQNPFDNPDFGANALTQAFQLFNRLQRKIRRAVELQASQVLQTGELTLPDQTGNNVFSMNFSPKATHFSTVAATWALDGTTGTPLTDIGDLATIIRRDGKQRPDRLIFGEGAMRRFLANADVVEILNSRRMVVASVAPETRGGGATFRGMIWIDHYEYEMWMYDGYFRPPGQGSYSTYVDDDKVILMSSNGRLDLTFGAIPSFVAPEQRALPFLPSRLSSEEGGFALDTNSWLSPDGKTLNVSAGIRPLCIPVAIDTFGALDVVI